MNDIVAYLGAYTIYFVGLIAGVLHIARHYDDEKLDNLHKKIRYFIHGIIGSMFFTYVIFEILLYFGFNERVSVAMAGGVAYLGAEKVSDILEDFLKKKGR